MTQQEKGQCFIVGDWRVSADRNLITRGIKSHRLEPKCMQVLMTLASHANEVVSRDTLLETVWPRTCSGDEALTRCICHLRRNFNDDPQNPAYIETIPKKGYRLLAACHYAPTTKQSPPVGSQPVRQLRFTRVLAVLAGIAIVAQVAYMTKTSVSPSPAETVISVVAMPEHSITVLPFENLTGDPEIDSFSDGISTTIRSVVSKENDIVVVAFRPLESGTPEPEDLRLLAERIGVSNVLRGSVQRSGHELRVTTQLVDGSSGFNIWSKSFNLQDDDLFQAEDEIAEKVVFQIRESGRKSG